MATQIHGEADKRSGSGRPAKGGPRTTPAVFIRQIAAELRKVIWPTRNVLITYTVVCLVFVVIMATYVTLLDVGFAKLMFWVF
jgi:preprotein translocase subunit SecE